MITSKEEQTMRSPYRKTISQTKITSKGLVDELGIIDFNVNPEYIPSMILKDIEENVGKTVIKNREANKDEFRRRK